MSEEEKTQDDSGKIENLFSKFGKRLDHLFDKAKESGVRDEVEERLEELKKSAGKVEDDFKEWKDNNQDRWKDTGDTLDRTSKIIRDGVKDIIEKVRQESKKKEEDSSKGDE